MPRLKLGGQSRFDKIISAVRTAFNQRISKIGYDFWKEMTTNSIATSSKPEREAVIWYKKTYRNDRDAWLRKGYMKPGRLYIFDYKKPKNIDTLPWFDTNPLVLSLGIFKTKDGKKRNIGINLHLLPPKVRRLVVYTVFTAFKTQYKKNLYADDPKDIPAIKWQMIQKLVSKYGTAFALRMYIPELQKNIIEFKVEDMPKAIWIPSTRYEKTNAYKLEKEWRKYLAKERRVSKLVGSEGHKRAV